jgi:nucleotide-binding universal stress UspA family protein
MFRSILVPLDGSPFGEQALPLALGIARRAGAALKLLHVQVPLVALPPEAGVYLGPPIEEEIARRQRAYLDGVARRIAADSSVPVSTAIVEGEVAPMIRAHAAQEQVDLVVMSTHGRGPLARFWLGSVADELVRELAVPLMLVRPQDQAVDFRSDPVPRHILLPLDGTPTAEQIIPAALAVGKLVDADYTLVRVIGPVMPTSYYMEGSGLAQMAETMLDEIEQMQSQLRQEAQTYLEGVSARLREQSLRVQTRVVVDAQPASAILKASAALGNGLIALETHGRRGLQRMFLGSVADKVVRGASLPVLVHHPVHP